MSLKFQRITMRKLIRHVLLMMSDAALISLALLVSHVLTRKISSPFATDNILVYFGFLPVLGVLTIYRLGIYRSVLLYINTHSLLLIVKSATLITASLLALIYLDSQSPFSYAAVPVFWLLSLVFIGGSRICVNLVLQNLVQNFRPKEAVVIYGAGTSGTQLAAALLSGNQFLPVAFVDDNDSIHGDVIHGIRVFSPHAIDELISIYNVRQILLAIPSCTMLERRTILHFLEKYPVHVKTIPDLFAIVSGKVGIDQIRDIEIEDLLQRTVVPPYTHLLSACIKGNSVMVTGAGGSIGGELCRQILRLKPDALILLDNSEYGLYRIEAELEEMLRLDDSLKPVKLIPILGTVRNGKHMEKVLTQFAVTTVYHAAAYKHLPMVEKNIVQGVYNNIFGTLEIARAAVSTGVRHFVFVSTDKAVRPSSIMGATKRFAEQILQSLSTQSDNICFSMVRFGNVLGSSGSVVPIFRKQINRGGPVTVTHPEVTRYFMTVQEAAQLVIQAGAMANGGDVFVLDMHEPVKILDLARKMIHLMGFMVKDENNLNGDIEIVFTGLRPGEKLSEELLIGEQVTGTEHPSIMRAEEDFTAWEQLEVMLQELDMACEEMNQMRIREILSSAIGGFVSRVTESDPILTATAKAQDTDPSEGKVTRLFK